MHFIQRADEESGVQPMIAMLRSKYTFMASLHFANFTVVVWCNWIEDGLSCFLSLRVYNVQMYIARAHTFACRSTWQAPESMKNRASSQCIFVANLVHSQTNKRFQWNAINFLLLQWSFCKIPFSSFFLSLSLAVAALLTFYAPEIKKSVHLHSTQISTQLRM